MEYCYSNWVVRHLAKRKSVCQTQTVVGAGVAALAGDTEDPAEEAAEVPEDTAEAAAEVAEDAAEEAAEGTPEVVVPLRMVN